MPNPSRLGIIAGRGDLPPRLAEAAAAAGRDPFVLCLAGAANMAALSAWPHAVVDMLAVGRILRVLRDAGCGDVVMAGPVERPSLSSFKPVDWAAIRLLPRVIAAGREGDDALLRTLVTFLEEEGFRVIGADDVMADLLVPAGPLGRHRPNDADLADIRRAVTVVLALGSVDVGQGAVVRDGLVLGVEAAEGTDALLARCADLQPPGRGGVLVKLAKPIQERRIDLPTIGPETVAGAVAARLAGIAVEQGGVLVLHRTELLAAADEAGLFVFGIDCGLTGVSP